MADTSTPQHVHLDELLLYLRGELEGPREEALTRHLENCDECGDWALEVGKDIATLQRWSPEAHGQAYRAHLHEAVGKALRTVAEGQQESTIAARVRRWLERGDGQAEAAVGIYFDAAQETFDVSADGLEFLIRPGAALLVDRTTPVTQGKRSRKRISVEPLRDDTAVPLSRAATPTESRTFNVVSFDEDSSFDKSASSHRVDVRVLADRTVAIEINRTYTAETAPLIILVDIEERCEPALEMPRSTHRGFEARFENIEPGNYVVLFEPAPCP